MLRGLDAPTGYGAQTKLFAPRLAEHHELTLSSFYGLEGARLAWEGIEVLPGLGGEYGNASLMSHARHCFGESRDGLVVTLIDVWVLSPQVVSQLNCACWVPIDHAPAPPAVLRFFAESGAVPIAMSRFGVEQLQGLDPLYVPHAVDTEVFRPHDRSETRALVGVDEDAFLVGMVAANKGRPSRKGFQQALEAFALFRRRHPKALLYLHTIVDPNYSQGEDLASLMAALGLPDDSVRICDQYRMAHNPLGEQMMARIYSTFDVLVNPAQGEGFGIPIMEAQACGVPVIVTDFSAMREVCGAGWRVGATPVWTGQGSWQAVAKVGDIVQALEDCHALGAAKRIKLSDRARRHALGYDVEKVLDEQMLPALEQASERFEARKPIEVAA